MHVLITLNPVAVTFLLTFSPIFESKKETEQFPWRGFFFK